MSDDRVDQKAVLGIDHLVARTGIGATEQAEQLVGAGTADDALRVGGVLPQLPRSGVHVSIEVPSERLL